jgi:tetratricopeptide (TPR) repeat protein
LQDVEAASTIGGRSDGDVALDAVVDLRAAVLAHYRSGAYAEALALIEPAQQACDDLEEHKWLATLQLRCLSKIADWRRLKAAAGAAVARFPKSSEAYGYLGEALLRLDEREEARTVLAQAVQMNPQGLETRALLHYAEGQHAPIRTRQVRVWPSKQRQFENPKRLVERYVTGPMEAEPFIESSTQFFTLGSCFALNLSKALTRQGFASHHIDFNEDFNSTFANLHLLRWCALGPVDETTRYLDAVLGPPVRDRLVQSLKTTDCVVLTLGLAAAHFHDATGAFGLCLDKSTTSREIFGSTYSLKTSTVAQNVANLEAIVELVDQLARPGCRIVLTVSPVPMAGSTEFESAVLSDCLSKSTLKLASHEFLASCRRPGLHYWPSFEIVKWLGAHYPRTVEPVFGAEDGETRHVSGWVVAMIIELFIAKFSKGGEDV